MKQIDKLEVAILKEEVKPETKSLFKKGMSLLADPFNYYSFGIQLNKNQQNNISEKFYLRYYQSLVYEMQITMDSINNELDSSQKTRRSFIRN